MDEGVLVKPSTKALADGLVTAVKEHVAREVGGLASAERVAELMMRVAELERRLDALERPSGSKAARVVRLR
jgi:hypothetical protein